jgi:hypothetical protein
MAVAKHETKDQLQAKREGYTVSLKELNQHRRYLGELAVCERLEKLIEEIGELRKMEVDRFRRQVGL